MEITTKKFLMVFVRIYISWVAECVCVSEIHLFHIAFDLKPKLFCVFGIFGAGHGRAVAAS